MAGVTHEAASPLGARYRLAGDTIGADEIAAAKEALDSGLFTMGARVQAFEAEFAAWVGARHAVMVNSGSSANLILVEALLRGGRRDGPLAPGDEVLVPGLAWPTTVWPIVQLGLIPVFVDIDPVTLGMDLESAGAAIGPRTRAMFTIHPLGRALDIPSIRQFCDLHDLVLLEDTCESLGAHDVLGRHSGTVGWGGTFSFFYSHHISTMEGGMVVTNDDALADDLHGFRAHGWIRDRADRARWVVENPGLDPRFMFVSTGYNVRPTEIQAAIGRVQLRRLDSLLGERETLAQRVYGWLQSSAPWLELVGSELLVATSSPKRSARRHSWMTFPLRLGADAPLGRDALTQHLERAGVETRPVIAGNLARHPALQRIRHRSSPSLASCDAILSDALMIGCNPTASPESLAVLAGAIASLASF